MAFFQCFCAIFFYSLMYILFLFSRWNVKYCVGSNGSDVHNLCFYCILFSLSFVFLFLLFLLFLALIFIFYNTTPLSPLFIPLSPPHPSFLFFSFILFPWSTYLSVPPLILSLRSLPSFSPPIPILFPLNYPSFFSITIRIYLLSLLP